MFDPAVLRDIQEHANKCFPQESCGVVTKDGFLPMENIHEAPVENFRLPPLATEMLRAGELLAVVHSHTNQLDHPSQMDQEQQLATDIPWGLTITNGGTATVPFFWGDGIPEQPIMPRDFRWGPAGTDGKGDCYALVRDWYKREMDIDMPNSPRAGDWMSINKMLYVDNARALGFRPINEGDLQYGDAVMMAIHSGGIPCHAGIYLGDGYILHHPQNGLVTRVPLRFARRMAARYMRPPAKA